MEINDLGRKSRKKFPQLLLEEVSFSWPSGKKALENCTLSYPGPGLWMLVGSNGSGKSTLFKLISGMLEPQSGRIQCDFKPALMFQNPDHQLLLPSCGSDLLLSLPKGLNSVEREERIRNGLELVGLRNMSLRPIHTLSGGQKQRVALAGALISEANLLLLDEPTALLDPDSQKNIVGIVQRLCSDVKNPITALWITHRLDELQFCNGAALMENGQVGPWQSSKLIRKRLKSLAVRRV